MKNKAQGTIEYLIIIAIIVVIVLIVVSMLVNQAESFSQTASTANKLASNTYEIKIEDSFQSQDGYYAIILKGNIGENLKIKSITIEESKITLSGNDLLTLGSKKAFIIPATNPNCTNKDIAKKTVSINYTSASGLDKNLTYPEKINFECSNQQMNFSITTIGLDGITQANAKTSCREIYLTNPNSADGNYWIDPNGGDTSDAFKAYCDIADGGWTRILSLIDEGPKTNNLLNKGITFTKFRAVKATDHSIYQEATFLTPQNANLGLNVLSSDYNTKVMLTGPGGYGVWSWRSFIPNPCSWGAVTMFGAGFDGTCGTESNLKVGRNFGASAYLVERFDVDLFVQ